MVGLTKHQAVSPAVGGLPYGSDALDDPPLSSDGDEDPESWKRGDIKRTLTTGKRPSATTATSATASASATSPPVSAYEVFATELEGRLRKTNPSASAASLKSVMQRRWEAMSEMHRAVYATMALDEAKSRSGTVAPTTSTPAAPASTSTASTSRKYNGFEYYLNTEGLTVRRRNPVYSHDQVVEATKRQWDALNSTERSNYSNKAFAAAQHPLDKGVFTWLEESFKRANKGKATVASTPAAPSYNASTSSSSGGGQADGFGFWLKFEERKFREKNPSFTHEEAVAALKKTWDGMTQMARGIYEDMAAKSTPKEGIQHTGYDWFLASEGCDLKKSNPDISYASVVATMKARWDTLGIAEKRKFEGVAETLRSSSEGRKMFNRLREAFGLPPHRGPPSEIPPTSSSAAAASRSRSPSDAGRYDGFTWFLNSAGVDLKKRNPGMGYDEHRTKMYSQWGGLKATQRREYEKVAVTLRQSAEGRAMFNRLREEFGLPPERDPLSYSPGPPPATATATTATASSSTTSSNASRSITREEWERRYDGFNFYLNTEGRDLVSKHKSYDSIVAAIKAKWEGISAHERSTWERLAESWRNNDRSRKEGFNQLRMMLKLPLEPDIPPPPVTATTASSSTPSSNVSGGITWEAWAEKYDGFTWFLNTRGYDLKQKNRELDYDLVLTIAEGWWERITAEERREFEDKAKMMRTSLGGRRMFNKLRRLCGLPEEPDVPQPAKTVTPRTPFQNTWRGSGSKSATSLLSSSPTRPDLASFSPADRALTEIQPNRMATSSSTAAAATPGLSDKVAKIDITSAWAVKSSRLKIPPLTAPRSGSGSASASGSAPASASRGVKRKAEPDVIDLTLDD
ncbi:hypothetical protein N0V85_008381 [Neurospora sp. IMI 360204]|nr:hypothetical protein N0V85_008381 [Neurospora sp. IMI 360204]